MAPFAGVSRPSMKSPWVRTWVSGIVAIFYAPSGKEWLLDHATLNSLALGRLLFILSAGFSLSSA